MTDSPNISRNSFAMDSYTPMEKTKLIETLQEAFKKWKVDPKLYVELQFKNIYYTVDCLC